MTTGVLVGRVARHSRLLTVALLSTLLVAGTLDLPWRLAAIGFGLVTIYAGIRALSDLLALRRTGHPAPGRVGVILAIGVSGLMVLNLLGEIALYPLFAEQDRCLAGAITHQEQQHCHQEFERRQGELLRRLGAPSPTRR